MKPAIATGILAVLLGAVCCLEAVAADVVVIANKANSNAGDKAFVVRVYTGEAKSWADGSPVVAYDQGEDNPVRADFYGSVIGKSLSHMQALRAQNVFSGRGLPPKVYDSDAETKKAVAANTNAIGYIRAGSVDATVRVLLK